MPKPAVTYARILVRFPLLFAGQEAYHLSERRNAQGPAERRGYPLRQKSVKESGPDSTRQHPDGYGEFGSRIPPGLGLASSALRALFLICWCLGVSAGPPSLQKGMSWPGGMRVSDEIRRTRQGAGVLDPVRTPCRTL